MPVLARAFTYAVLFIGLVLVFVLFHEEPRLGRRFGEEYAAYCRVVGRWFPKSGIW